VPIIPTSYLPDFWRRGRLADSVPAVFVQLPWSLAFDPLDGEACSPVVPYTVRVEW